MVTKYDVFFELYKSGNSKGTIDIVKVFKQKKTEYQRIRKILDTLVGMKLIEKNKYGYQATMNAKHQHLFDMLKYCIKNGVNYNELFNESVAKYLSKAFLKKSFGMKDLNLNAKTVSKVSNILEKNGFLLVLSRKPFKAVVPYNSFLGDLVVYYGHHPMVTKKKEDEYFDEIQSELSKFKKLRVSNVRKYQELTETYQIKFIHHSLSIEGNPITLAQTFKLLRDKIVPENLSMESVHEVENYQKAFSKMIENVQDNSAITKENILNYHFIAMQHKTEIAGRFRDDRVIIRGHLEYKENMKDAVRRELKEETDLEATNFKFLNLINDTRQDEHYLQVGFLAEGIDEDKEPRLMEPDRCKEWRWFDLDNLPENIFIGHIEQVKAFKENEYFIDGKKNKKL